MEKNKIILDGMLDVLLKFAKNTIGQFLNKMPTNCYVCVTASYLKIISEIPGFIEYIKNKEQYRELLGLIEASHYIDKEYEEILDKKIRKYFKETDENIRKQIGNE